jgi:hypothetical protein
MRLILFVRMNFFVRHVYCLERCGAVKMSARVVGAVSDCVVGAVKMSDCVVGTVPTTRTVSS